MAARETPESRSPSALITLARAIQRLFKTIPQSPESAPQTISAQAPDRPAAAAQSTVSVEQTPPASVERVAPTVPFMGHVVPNLKPVNSHGHEPLIRLSADTAVPAPVGQRARRSIPQDVKIAVSVRDGGRCRQCGSAHQLHFDHVIPVSRGGANTAANVQLLCGSCNRAKSAKLKLAAGRIRPCGRDCSEELS